MVLGNNTVTGGSTVTTTNADMASDSDNGGMSLVLVMLVVGVVALFMLGDL